MTLTLRLGAGAPAARRVRVRSADGPLRLLNGPAEAGGGGDFLDDGAVVISYPEGVGCGGAPAHGCTVVSEISVLAPGAPLTLVPARFDPAHGGLGRGVADRLFGRPRGHP